LALGWLGLEQNQGVILKYLTQITNVVTAASLLMTSACQLTLVSGELPKTPESYSVSGVLDGTDAKHHLIRCPEGEALTLILTGDQPNIAMNVGVDKGVQNWTSVPGCNSEYDVNIFGTGRYRLEIRQTD